MRLTHSNAGRARRGLGMVALAVAALAATACDTQSLLEVTDPDIINPTDLTTAAAANALRVGAMGRLAAATTAGANNNGGESTFLLGGLLADEYRSSDTFDQRNETDRRSIQTTNANTTSAFRALYRARLGATQAIDALRQFNAPSWQIGQMYFVKAFAENQLAQDFCGHIPFSEFVEGREEYTTPLTTQAAFELALAHADSAIAAATGTTADAVAIRTAAQLLRGRILLNLDRPAEAATAVANVPTTFRFNMEHSANTWSNATWVMNNNIGRWYVSQGEGVNGLNFTNDPRIPTCRIQGTSSAANGTPVGCGSDTPVRKPFDPATPVINGTTLIIQQKWDERYDPQPILIGQEARLIEAEAQLAAGNAAGALNTLNTLRASVNGLAPLTDAGTAAGRIDQIMTERAYWLFGLGTRLNDLRRLIRDYGRTANSVFPTGTYWKPGGDYGNQVNIPVPQAEENNPQFVRASCVDTQA